MFVCVCSHPNLVMVVSDMGGGGGEGGCCDHFLMYWRQHALVFENEFCVCFPNAL